MSPDESPVENTEYLLRRVPSDPAKFCFPDGPTSYVAFIPASEDGDGLSLYRELTDGTATGFLTAVALLGAAANPRVRDFGGIVATLTRMVRELNLAINPSPDELPGHAIIPQINRIDYDTSKVQKRQIKDWADKLARECQVRIAPRPLPV